MKSPSIFDLSGRVVLLTGATGHLGRAMARGLCQAGAKVLLNSRSEERAAETKTAMAAESLPAEVLVFDITNDKDRMEAIRDVGERYGRLDVLVNNAFGVISTEGTAAFESAYKAAVVSTWQLVQDSLGLLRRAAQLNSRGASIINVASMYGLVSPDFAIYTDRTPKNPVYYGPAKAALLQLTRYMASELGSERIRVNAISPGPFPNPTVCESDPEFVQRLAKKNPLGRIGQPHELVGPVVFLASDAASYITGANLAVDGGWTAL